jgi:putative transposase
MPNHFHFILYAKKTGTNYIMLNGKQTNMQCLSKSIGKTLSSFTQAINIQQNRTGALFQKKTRAKDMSNCDSNYLLHCLHYIHLNPVQAGMVDSEAKWEFSSFQDYYGLRKGTLCNKELFFKLSGTSESELPMTIGMNEEIIRSFY